ncbi:hypothetical protein IG9_01052 [Bacillus cereus HuA2-9]|nr:hypothetical protein IG9_01052 [Bacillus cereus HuA2-9]
MPKNIFLNHIITSQNNPYNRINAQNNSKLIEK